MKIILTPLSGAADGHDNVAIDSALIIARHFGAHVKCFHVKSDPRSAVAFVGEGMTSAMIESVIEMTGKDVAQKSMTAKALFKECSEKNDIPIIEDISSSAPDGHSSELIIKSGNREGLTVELGKMTDLIVMCKAASADSTSNELLMNAVLRETGRPVFMTNSVASNNFFETIAVAWNGSVESSRAISYALPFLKKANKVTLISVSEDEDDDVSSEFAMNYLAWHGIHANQQTINATSGKTIAGSLISHAAKLEAGMLVMGAYTNSRLHRLIFGAVTREILEKCPIPVLMTH